MEYKIVAKSVSGPVHIENQDSAIVRYGNILNKEILLAAICDGVGSLESSGKASALVINMLDNWYTSFVEKKEIPSLENGIISLQKLFEQANIEVLTNRKKGMEQGTTATVLLIIDGKVGFVHVGDTRIYSVGESFNKLTTDDTLVEFQLQKGIISMEEYSQSPRRHVLIKCIGATENLEVETEIVEERIDSFLICSDGLRNLLKPKEIESLIWESVFLSEEDMGKMLDETIDEVIKRGERDNITGIIISRNESDTQILNE